MQKQKKVMKNVPFFKSKKLLSVTLCTIAFVAILGIFFSCAKEELDYGKLNLIGDPKPIMVNATLPKSASLDKTTLSTDGKVCWESDDKITVNDTKLEISEILSDGTLAEFQGSVGSLPTPAGEGYWATYPTSLGATNYSSASVSVTLPATQTYNGDCIPSYMAAFNTANGDNLNLQFKNLCCIIKFQVKSQDNGNKPENTLSRIVVASSQNIAGTATVQMDGSGNPTFSSWTDGGRVLTLDCGNTRLNNSTGVTFSVMVPAGTQDLTVKYYDATGKYMRKTVSGKTLVRSNMYNLSATLVATEEEYVFSVSSTDKVVFSLGNLQWTSTGTHAVAGGGTADGTWRFAEHQWDYVGYGKVGTVYEGSIICNNASISSTYTGWIDYFGWGTSGYKGKYPYMTSGNNSDYGDGSSNIAGTNYDWGIYNAIYNPQTEQTDSAGTWRTLTNAEWAYLLGTSGSTRGGTNSKWWIYNIVTITDADGTSDVPGLIIYPDGVTAQPSGLSKTLTKNNATNVNVTKADFDNLEAMGCVFLPAAGYRSGTSGANVKLHGNYWSSTNYVSGTVYYLVFHNSGSGLVEPSHIDPRCWGRSVRLVKDVVE